MIPEKLHVVLCGVGKIGRGIIAKSVLSAGHSLTMLDVSTELVGLLRDAGSYTVQSIDNDVNYCDTVSGYNIFMMDSREGRISICEADLIFTAVGVNNLFSLMKIITPFLLERITLGKPPVDIIFCENMVGVSKYISGILRKKLAADPAVFKGRVGFAGGSVGVVVPPPTDPLHLVKGPYEDIHIEEKALITDIRIPHFVPVSNFELCIREKLYIYNMAHALVSYLGWMLGYEYVDQAFMAPEIIGDVRSAMNDVAHALANEYNVPFDELAEVAADIETRICNKQIRDTIVRIAEDPVRKLSHNDRLVGAYLLAQNNGIECEAILKGIAAGFLFSEPSDRASLQIQKAIKEHGIRDTVIKYTGLHDESVISSILSHYECYKLE
ncbi:MAG: hypothetical protein WCG21_12370 [Eubacteriales bacterium]